MKRMVIVILILSTLLLAPSISGVDDSITIDPESPNGENSWYISDVYVTFHAYDPPLDSSGLAYIYYRIIETRGEEPRWERYEIEGFTTEYDFTVHLDKNGRYIVEFYAEDHAGNKGPIHSTPEIKIDKTPPTSEIIIPKDGYIYLQGEELMENPFGGTLILGGINVRVDASDETSGVNMVHFEFSDGSRVYSGDDTEEPYIYMFLKTYLKPTSCTLRVFAKDTAGNIGVEDNISFKKWL